MLLILTFIITGCATSKPENELELVEREVPTQEDCKKSSERVSFRSQFFKSLRGRGLLETEDSQFDLDIALLFPDKMRIEVNGPLGIKYALVVSNEKWVMVFIPKQKAVYRIPTRELLDDQSERGLVYKKNIPFDLNPSLLVPALLSMAPTLTGGALSCQKKSCHVNEQWRTLEIASSCKVADKNGKKYESLVQIHPEFAFPLEWKFGDQLVVYKSFTGAGVSSLPSEIVFSDLNNQSFTFSWIEAEKWENPDSSVFEWKIPPGTEVKDY